MISQKKILQRGFISVLLRILFLTLSLGVLFYLINQFDYHNQLVHDLIYEIVLFSSLIAFVVASFSHFVSRKNDSTDTVLLVIGSTSIRMILSIFVLTFLLFKDPENRLLLVVNFLIVYLFYLLFEIYFIITNLRQISKKDIS